MLVDARRRVQEHGGSLKLVRPAPLVRRVLEVTGMTAVFPIDLWGGAGHRAHETTGRHRDPL